MKLITFKNKKGQTRIGWLTPDGQGVVDMKLTDKRLPNDMLSFIDKHEQYFKIIKDNNLENTPPQYWTSDVGCRISDSEIRHPRRDIRSDTFSPSAQSTQL